MAVNRDAAAGAEGYPAEDDATGAGRHPDDRRPVGERPVGEPARGESVHRPEGGAGSLHGEPGAGREELTGDGRTPPRGAEAHPGTTPAGTTGAAGAGAAGTGAGTDTGAMRDARTGTRGAGTDGPGTRGTDTARTGTPGTGVDEGAGAADRSESGTGARGAGTPGASAPGERTTGDGGAVPAPHGAPGRGAATASGRGVDTGHPGSTAARTGDTGRPGTEGKGSGGHAPLLATEEAEKWEAQLRQTLAGFVEEPRTAVEEADRTLEEIAARFGEAVTRRRRTLRTSWESGEGSDPARHETDTEQLRLALRDYRELADRLLHL
ncbi:hypothetical protein [Streptomyces cellostaticus]|uniref:hypothetical protein n=1 Tax=Streptomyces cellostaticus TaxID=67285 RepID=UPI0020266CA2|nr:hypothetical protein [Streptomyces cellostaticus]